MRVLMLGWEFPPYISGGLGTACYGLTRGLDRLGTSITFVLPRPVAGAQPGHVELVSGDPTTVAGTTTTPTGEPSGPISHLKLLAVNANLQPYGRPEDFREPVVSEVPAANATKPASNPGAPGCEGGHYDGDLFGEIDRYARAAHEIAQKHSFDVVHAHDWMTYLAGMAAAEVSGKPLVVHVHSTEFDRSGLHVNQRIYDIERAGLHAADRIIAVSHLTRNLVIRHYGIDATKVEVVYNAIDENGNGAAEPLPPITRHDKIVLFLGRITMQKGPEYFLSAAKRVLEVMDNVRFVMAGSGDLVRPMIEKAAEMGIGHRVLFTGFLRGDDVRKVFRMADLYVMPSVSEPFGIAPLEALAHNVPVLISKQSGVAEVLTHALKVDFWDVNEMANKILAVLRHPPLQQTLRDHGNIEVSRFSWSDAAALCIRVYEQVRAARGV
ncbi:MAG: glycosyltransferase family 4 protein [Phycisphaerae bacterium]|nr:glycosyltransferase family 4 protein [Phycisphaerae bacterium]